MVCHYECWWEAEIEIDEEGFDSKVLDELIAQDGEAKTGANTLSEILHPQDFDDIINSPAYRFAELVGLPHYKWLSYHYVEQSFDREEHLFDEAIHVK